ncbi:unnamed protein product [Dracunculus medinensis]|uniref:Solute carrier family 30 member 9 n=1 Tax=Dracunculus medinensis TaxID=318479 RepID=A0A0N4U0U6_DRAME|nr:unnamed protein product [Dracunculus medinensis]
MLLTRKSIIKLRFLLRLNFREVNDFSKDRLFRFPRRALREISDNEISEERAILDYCLTKEQLKDLSGKLVYKRGNNLPEISYSLSDVYKLAMKIHGNEKEMREKRRIIIGIRHRLSEAQRLQMHLEHYKIFKKLKEQEILEEREGDASDSGRKRSLGANRVVAIAFTLNCCDTVSKYVAAYLTGSKSLFAEAIHSTMDTLNQLILLTGIRVSKRTPDKSHPYGYGNMRYVSSLISGCGILSFGCGLSIYHGISGLLHPTQLEPLIYAYLALTVSFIFQGSSALTAFREVRLKAKSAKLSFFDYLRISSDPTLNVVLLEDSAAVCGVLIALTSISLSSILNSTVPDSIGSILIGIVLGMVSTFIIRTNAAHLVGQSLPSNIIDSIVISLGNDPAVKAIHDVKATAVGVGQSRFKAEVDFDGRAITNKYICECCNMPNAIQQARSINSEEDFREFMLEHGEKIIRKIGDEVDRIESELIKKYPEVRHVDLESV